MRTQIIVDNVFAHWFQRLLNSFGSDHFNFSSAVHHISYRLKSIFVLTAMIFVHFKNNLRNISALFVNNLISKHLEVLLRISSLIQVVKHILYLIG